MNKEYLEAFRDILGILSAVSGCEVDMDSEHIKAVDKALQRLEAIDNSNPSEALNRLIAVGDESKYWNPDNYVVDVDVLKQALLKSQEQEKVLNIIKEKYVHIPQLLCAFENQLEEANPLEFYYNGQVGINVPMPLTQEEFDLLKEYFKYE